MPASASDAQSPEIVVGRILGSFAVRGATLGAEHSMTEAKRMELVIPDGAQVHITIGTAPLLALPGQAAPDILPPPTPASPLRRARPLLKGALAIALLLGAFQVGRHHGGRADPVVSSSAALVAPHAGPVGEQHAFPERALPRDAAGSAAGPQPTSAAGQVPPALAEQLRQPPTVTPPPGQAPPTTPLASFGLHE